MKTKWVVIVGGVVMSISTPFFYVAIWTHSKGWTLTGLVTMLIGIIIMLCGVDL